MRLLPAHVTSILRPWLALGLMLAASSGAAAEFSDAIAERAYCRTRLAPKIPGTALPEITDICRSLEAVTDPRLKEQLMIRERGEGRGLSVLPSKYSKTVYNIGKVPRSLPAGATLTGRLEFGYDLIDGFKFVGPLNYAVISREGDVLEVGGGSDLVLSEFRAHLFGRRESAEQTSRIGRINRELVEAIRSVPRFKAKLSEFARARHWPAGLEDRALLAYMDGSPALLATIKTWAKQRGYSFEDLRAGGWLKLNFGRDGRPFWDLAKGECVVIPFLGKDGYSVLSWRVRNMRSGDPTAPKYLSWPKDRAAADPEPTVPEQLYNYGVLSNVRGKTLVLTEGEFKSLVAQDYSGIATVGILGISNWGEPMVDALVHSGASDIVIILDRDPRASGLKRVDGVSDSQRAAYAIAVALSRAEAPSVRIGILPDVFNGSKVGIDDLLLAKGIDGLGLYLKTIADAMAPKVYAAKIGLDPQLFELMSQRRELSKKLTNYEESFNRGGPALDVQVYRRAQGDLALISEAYQNYLRTHYRGARRIDQPIATERTLFSQREIPDAASKQIRAQDVELKVELFTGDLLVLEGPPGAKQLQDFPPEDYIHDRDVSLNSKTESGWKGVARIPEVIRKKSSGRVYAIVLDQGYRDFGVIKDFLRGGSPAVRVVRPPRSPVFARFCRALSRPLGCAS